MVMEQDLTLDDEHTIQYIGDVLQNGTLETYIILLTNVNPMKSIKKKFFKSGYRGLIENRIKSLEFLIYLYWLSRTKSSGNAHIFVDHRLCQKILFLFTKLSLKFSTFYNL